MDIVSVNCLLLYFDIVRSILRRNNVPLPEYDVQQVRRYIRKDILEAGYAHTISRPKPLCITSDLTFINQKLFPPRFAAMFNTTYAVLDLVIILCLLTDGAGRPGEFLFPDKSVADKNRVMSWADVDFWVYNNESGVNEIRAQIHWTNLKTSSPERTDAKGISLRLLPPEFAHEDSLFLLLIKALRDEVFEHVSTWEDFCYFPARDRGSQIHIKPALLNMPVFRTCHRGELPSSTEPLRQSFICRQLEKVSRACGFKDRFHLYDIRRNTANILVAEEGDDEGRMRLGHRLQSGVYEKNYRADLPTVDYQARRLHTEEEDLENLRSVSLNSNTELPQHITRDFRKMFYSLDTVVMCYRRMVGLRAKVVEIYGSIEQAKDIGATDEAYIHYRRASNIHHAVSSRHSLVVFEKYRRKCFETGTTIEEYDWEAIDTELAKFVSRRMTADEDYDMLAHGAASNQIILDPALQEFLDGADGIADGDNDGISDGNAEDNAEDNTYSNSHGNADGNTDDNADGIAVGNRDVGMEMSAILADPAIAVDGDISTSSEIYHRAQQTRFRGINKLSIPTAQYTLVDRLADLLLGSPAETDPVETVFRLEKRARSADDQ